MSSTGPMSDQAWAMKLEVDLRALRAENARLRAALEKVLRTLPNGAWRDKLAPTIERALSYPDLERAFVMLWRVNHGGQDPTPDEIDAGWADFMATREGN